MFTFEFWKAATERAVKTAAQSLILVWPVADGALNLWQIDPAEAVGIAVGGALLSLLTSLASGRVGDRGSPSLSRSEVLFTADRVPK
jgi:hypothetical protein